MMMQLNKETLLGKEQAGGKRVMSLVLDMLYTVEWLYRTSGDGKFNSKKQERGWWKVQLQSNSLD